MNFIPFQTIFERYESKYLITSEQKKEILEVMASYMALDQYGRTTIRNIYFDTENYRLIRHSNEKPTYKEKLRIRSYQQATSDSTVFVELKKKYLSVVYKRRMALPEKEAMEWICGIKHINARCQISDEIDYFCDYYYGLRPAAFLSYDREAYYALDGSDFRVTFDDTIIYRQEDLSLKSAVYGVPLLGEGQVLMEVKSSTGLPLWMSRILSEKHIFKTSFSKYGTAYQKYIYPEKKEIFTYD